MDEIDKQILVIMQDNVPLVSRPFLEAAKKLGITEDEVISRIKQMAAEGIIRRFSASIRHRKLGIKANPMIAWKVPENNVEEAGKRMSAFKEVTHCYERSTVPGKWEYNLFTMIHAYNKKDAEKIVKRISNATGIKEYILLYSTKEYKKTYRRFIP